MPLFFGRPGGLCAASPAQKERAGAFRCDPWRITSVSLQVTFRSKATLCQGQRGCLSSFAYPAG